MHQTHHTRSLPILRAVRVAAMAPLIGALLILAGRADAQRRPGVGTGFYTYTGLLSTDVEAGSVTSTTQFAEAPRIAASVLVSAPLARLTRKAIIVGVRGTALSLGNTSGCVRVPPEPGCLQRRFTERVTGLVGGAFDIREYLLRVTAGPTLYSVESQGTRLGTHVRIDYTNPRQGSRMPTLFLSRSFLGSQRGRGVGMTTLGLGVRFAKKK